MLAPVVLFVYNRPWHTRQTLEALTKNKLADQSELIVFADGPKDDATEEEIKKIIEVRKIIKERSWCRTVEIIESETNKGLAGSVISGMNDVFNRFDKAIVLEDDIMTSCHFLEYMNDALLLYENENAVGGISGYSFIKSEQDTYFSTLASSWSWATWKRIWDTVIFSAEHWMNKINTAENIYNFNYSGSYDFYSILKKQYEKKVDSWAILFKATLFCDKKLFLFSGRCIVQNIGFDSGTHYSGGNRVLNPGKNLYGKFITIKKIPVIELEENKVKQMKKIRFTDTSKSSVFQNIKSKFNDFFQY